jgi:hypothetical protein
MSRNCIRPVMFSVLFWCFLAGAQESSPAHGSLVGDLADTFEGAPIPEAFVFVRGRGGVGEKVVELNAKGGFELSLPPGLYDVFAAQGFTSVRKGRSRSWDSSSPGSAKCPGRVRLRPPIGVEKIQIVREAVVISLPNAAEKWRNSDSACKEHSCPCRILV